MCFFKYSFKCRHQSSVLSKISTSGLTLLFKEMVVNKIIKLYIFKLIGKYLYLSSNRPDESERKCLQYMCYLY